MEAFLMLVIVVTGVLGIVFCGCCSDERKYNGMTKEAIALKSVGIASLAACAFCFFFLIYGSIKIEEMQFKRDENPYVTHSVIALQDNNDISGSFYIRRGYIEQNIVYVYAYKTSGGGMKLQKAGAQNTTVYFTDSVAPCVKWYNEHKSFYGFKQDRVTCDIYLPYGSLVEDYTIDLR